jgi:outer membrane protein assembly factor BamB
MNVGTAALKTALVAVWIAGVTACAQTAEGLLSSTGVKSGLCLVVGAKDVGLGVELARGSALYVQMLQPDEKLAAQWGAAVANSTNRESIGIRNADFDAEHYGSDLFNLIVVEDAAALGKAKLADLNRILVPNGRLALRSAPSGFAAEAKTLGINPSAAGVYAAVYAKPVKPVEWKLPLAQKWQAGPRSQIANGYSGVSIADGKLFYLEQMERDAGDLNNCAATVFARDAYNGRTLWISELSGTYHRGIGLVATSKGRLFVKTGDGKLLCLDGRTGTNLFEVASNVNREARIWLLGDDLLSIHGDVRAADTGKPLWKYPALAWQPLPGAVVGENIHFCDGKSIFARKLATGEEVWRVATTNLPRAVGPGALAPVNSNLLVRMAGTNKEEAAFAMLDAGTGELLWTYLWTVRIGGEPYFNAGAVRFTMADGKLLFYYRHNQPNIYPDEVVVTQLDPTTGKPDFEDKTLKDAGDYHGCFGELHLGDYIAWYDLWVNKRTFETARVGMPHPACFFGSSAACGLVYNFPSRKSGPITATGPADFTMSGQPGGKTFRKHGTSSSTEATKADDWPMFRGNPAGGNATGATLGGKLVKAWETPVGLGRENFGVMSSQRTGLAQPVLAYGLAVVADIDGERIVALNAEDGEEKWVFHVGSRVDFPPTLHKGLCLVPARDGWVYALDAKTGALVWKLLVPAQERYIGGREKLESVQALRSDVRIVNDQAFVEGGPGLLAFNPVTGEVLAGVKPPGRVLQTQMDLYGYVIKGNSIPRTNEDNWPGAAARGLDGRVMAFDDELTVAYRFKPAGEGWANKGTLSIVAVKGDPKAPLWTVSDLELVADDLLLTPTFLYAVGHYQRIKKNPELWVMSREDGKVVNTIPVEGYPAFMGMSAANGRLYVATREGKLICYRGQQGE